VFSRKPLNTSTFYLWDRKVQTNEKKLKKMEEERPDEMEMAA
jgi:hypothetical protein